MGESGVDAGSFRDREGRIYHSEGRIFRGLSQRALDAFHALSRTRFYSNFLKQGKLIDSRVVSGDERPLPGAVHEHWAGFLEHPRVPLISYPYEWTFGMLRDAAALQLELVEAALLEDMALKDATPYNIQFVSGQPVFIDISSFEPLEPGAPWAGYRQFCELFLFPLMVQAYKGIDFQPFLRSRIDGVSVQTAARIFGWRDRFRRGVLSHVWLQSRLDRRYSGTSADIKSDLKSAGFNREMILANVRKLRRLVRGLEWQGSGSEWGSYETFHNYSEEDRERKARFVDECVVASGARRVWDLGCNTGQFAKIAARHADQVLALDRDHFAVERLYREIRSRGLKAIQPLVQDVVDPSPNWGWRQRERSDLRSRSQPDLILCLALVHHVVISANIPLGEFVDWLAGIAPNLVIEFVSRDDDKVRTLLRNKVDRYSDYSREGLEGLLRKHYAVRQMAELNSGKRFLYWASQDN